MHHKSCLFLLAITTRAIFPFVFVVDACQIDAAKGITFQLGLPQYSESQVGEAFAKNKTVTVAKMDATANDVPSDKFSVSYSAILAPACKTELIALRYRKLHAHGCDVL